MILHETFPFIPFGNMSYPVVWVRFLGANKTQTQPIMAQIDTGSNYCFFPGEVIEDIGGKLERGRIAPIKVIGGEYTGYVHSVKMEVLKTGVDGRPASDEDGNKVVFFKCQKQK